MRGEVMYNSLLNGEVATYTETDIEELISYLVKNRRELDKAEMLIVICKIDNLSIL